jgi:hypothetical protein
MHRETLEIRLATEELWVQLSGAAPPVALTRSLARIRSQLADDYRLAKAELDGQRQELDRLREEMKQQHERLVCRKRELEIWARQRQAELQQQAAHLEVEPVAVPA